MESNGDQQFVKGLIVKRMVFQGDEKVWQVWGGESSSVRLKYRMMGLCILRGEGREDVCVVLRRQA